MFIGIGLRLGGARGATGPYIARTASSFPENTASGTTIATLSVANHPSGSSGWTFAETADPDNKFNPTITAGALKTNATVDYETKTSHSVTITASKSGQTDIVQTLVFFVTNVFEQANLSALALSGADDLQLTATDSGTITGATSGSTISVTGLPTGFTINGPARTWAYDGTGSATTAGASFVETLADSANSPRTTPISITIAAGPAFTANPAITYAEGADLNPGLVVAFDRGTATGAFGNFRLYKNGADFADASSGSGTLSSTGSYQLRSYLADNVTYALSNTVVIVEAEVGDVDAPVLSNPDDFVSGTNPPNTKVSITDNVDKSLYKLVGEWDNLASGGFSYDAGRTFQITDLPGFFGPEGTGETFAIAEYAALAAGPFPLNFRVRTKYVPLSGSGPSSPYSNTWTDTLNAVPVTYAAFDPAKRTLVSAALRGTLSGSNRVFSHDAGFDNEVLQIGGDQLLTSAIGVFEWRMQANAGGAFVGFANSANDFTARFNEWGATAGTFACAGGGDIVRAGSGSFVGFPASISVGAWAAWIVHKASNQAWLVHPNGTIYPNTPVFGADGSFTSGAGYATNLTSYYFGGNTKSIGDIFEINTGNAAFVRTMPAHTPTRWNGPPT